MPTKLTGSMCVALLLTTACGGGGSGSSDTPSIIEKDATITINGDDARALRNQLICYKGSSLTDEQIKKCDLRIYHVMISSFQDGDDSIGYGIGYGPSQHKGDIKGITNAVDYIAGLNMNAILTTPFMKSCDKDCTDTDEETKKLNSTGYFVSNYAEVDPNFGDDQDVEALANKLHENNMYFFSDIALGHFKNGVTKNYTIDGKDYTLVHTYTCINDKDNDNERKYKLSENGNKACTNFDTQDQSSQKFFEAYLAEYTKKWKLDGWRFDQAYQIPTAIQYPLEQAIIKNSYSYQNNQTDVGMAIAEIWKGYDKIKDWALTGEQDKGVTSAFSFPIRYSIVNTFAIQEWAAEKMHETPSTYLLTREFTNQQKEFPELSYPVSFITNHDLVRFSNLVDRAQATKRFAQRNTTKRAKLALAYLATLSGPIANFYGEEIGQKNSNYPAFPPLTDDGNNHCDRKNWIWDDNASRTDGKIDGLDEDETDIKEYFTALMKLRSETPALAYGRTFVLNQDTNHLLQLKTYQQDTNKDPTSAVLYGLNINNTATVTFEIKVGTKINIDSNAWIDFTENTQLSNGVTKEVYTPEYRKIEKVDENGNKVLDENRNVILEDDTSSTKIFTITLEPLSSLIITVN